MVETRTDLGKIFITNGGTYDATVTYEKLTMVSYNNSTYITLRTVTGVTPSDDRVNYLLMAQGFTATYLASVTAIDQQGIATEAGDEISAQLLINAIADRVANQLVSNSDLQDTLLDYVTKSAVTPSLNVTEDGKVLDAKAGKALNDAIASFGRWNLVNAQAAPQTATTYTTIQNRKFSDYDLLGINYVDANGTYVRAGVIIPSASFSSTSVLLSNNDGSNNNHNVEVKRISDTSYSLLANANSIGYKVSIQGIKISK